MLLAMFRLMLKSQYVPDSFGVGIIIHIPNSTGCVNDATEHYRGIIISSVTYNVFERCLSIMSETLLT